MKKLLAILAIAMMCTAAFANPPHHDGGPSNGHDGTWWQSKSAPFKDGFLIGYKDGLNRAGASASAATPPLGTPQLIEGLDHFYKDFRNVNVQVEDAMPYVRDELTGKSDADLATELQNLRKAAAAKAAAKEDE